MEDQPHKYRFKVLDNKTIKVDISEVGNAKIETDAFDPERPLFCAAFNGVLTFLELLLENGVKLPVVTVQETVKELYERHYQLPKLESEPDPKDYTTLYAEITVKGESADAQETLWNLLTSIPGVRKVDFCGESAPDDWDLELEDLDDEDEELPGASDDDPEAHRHIVGYCNGCNGYCNYDEMGRYVGAENLAFFSE